MPSNLKEFKIGVLVSGSGTNLQALIAGMRRNYFKSKILLVASDISAPGLKRAENEKIETLIFKNEKELLNRIEELGIDLLILAGYLKILTPLFLQSFKGEIINIHPSLLPKYGGKGMYGIKVHNAVFENREKFSGATVHYVDGGIDSGKIIYQREIDISKAAGPEEISEIVLRIEHEILSEVIKKLEAEGIEV